MLLLELLVLAILIAHVHQCTQGNPGYPEMMRRLDKVLQFFFFKVRHFTIG